MYTTSIWAAHSPATQHKLQAYRRWTVALGLLLLLWLPGAHLLQAAPLPAPASVLDAAATKLAADPALTYSTYVGGLSSDYTHDIAVDSAGNIYVAGYTYSKDLGGVPNSVKGFTDAFVGKLNPAGTAWQWITYIGGNKSEEAYGIAVDNDAIWITGYTDSTDFPVTANAHQSKFGGFYDVLLARLDPATGAVTYSSYFGLDQQDVGHDIALDQQGHVYITGRNNSANLLAMKVTGESNPKLVYSVQWGDDWGEDIGYGIVVDGAGNAYITGMTESAPGGTTFPIKAGAIQSACGPYVYENGEKSCTRDAFLSILNAAGDTLIYSSLLGGGGSPTLGSGTDEGRGIALDAQGNIYITGLTYADDFPTVNAAYQNYPDANNMDDAWVTKLTPDGKTILYSTYLGGDSSDEGQKIIADADGNAYVLGFSRSSDFPTLKALQSNLGKGGMCFSGSTVRACHDSFLTKLSNTGSVVWSTYLGAGWDEYGYSLTRNQSGEILVTGMTRSGGYPVTTGAVQPEWGGNEDGFISKISESGASVPPPPPPPPPSATVRNGDFEQGADGSWIESSSNFGGKGSLILTGDALQGVAPRSGKSAAWLGGTANETSVLSQTITLSNTATELHFYYQSVSTDNCGKDVAEVKVNETILKTFDLCQTNDTQGWTQSILDLAAYVGKSVTVRFVVRTDGGATSHFLLDDVALVTKQPTDPGTPPPPNGFRLFLPVMQR